MTTAHWHGARRRSPAPRPRPAALDAAAAIAAMAVRCLLLELETWPKPGLVSHVDPGSHDDMDADTFRASAAAIEPYLQRPGGSRCRGLRDGPSAGSSVSKPKRPCSPRPAGSTPIAAPSSAWACSARPPAPRPAGGSIQAMPLGAAVCALWGASILDGPHRLAQPWRRGPASLRRRRRAPGGRPRISQRLRGRPARPAAGRPARCRAIAEAARVEACFALIASVEDTNLLHRGGLSGLRFARRAAREFLDDGGVGQPGWRSARAACMRASSPAGSAPAGRPIFSP